MKKLKLLIVMLLLVHYSSGQVFFVAPVSGVNKKIYYYSKMYQLVDTLPILDFGLLRYDFKTKKYIFCFSFFKVKNVVKVNGIAGEPTDKYAYINRKVNYTILSKECVEPISEKELYESQSYAGLTVQFKDKVKKYQLIDAKQIKYLKNDSLEINFTKRTLKWRKSKIEIDGYIIIEAEYYNGEKELYISVRGAPNEDINHKWNIIVVNSKIKFVEFIN
jgi:hypothetical protein